MHEKNIYSMISVLVVAMYIVKCALIISLIVTISSVLLIRFFFLFYSILNHSQTVKDELKSPSTKIVLSLLGFLAMLLIPFLGYVTVVTDFFLSLIFYLDYPCLLYILPFFVSFNVLCPEIFSKHLYWDIINIQRTVHI